MHGGSCSAGLASSTTRSSVSGVVDQPIEWLLFSDFAVAVGMVAAYLPFAVVPMVLVLARIEPSVIRASEDLGAGFWTTLRRIVLPLAMPGVIAGFLFVFVVALGTSTEIQLLGGAGDSSIAIMINDVMRVVNFPLAFAIATAVVLLMLAVVLLADRYAQAVAHIRGTRLMNRDPAVLGGGASCAVRFLWRCWRLAWC